LKPVNRDCSGKVGKNGTYIFEEEEGEGKIIETGEWGYR